jgi:hypothetical protein
MNYSAGITDWRPMVQLMQARNSKTMIAGRGCLDSSLIFHKDLFAAVRFTTERRPIPLSRPVIQLRGLKWGPLEPY